MKKDNDKTFQSVHSLYISRIAALLCWGFLLPSICALADENSRPFVTLDVQDGQTFLFLGDSITHDSLYTQYVEDYFYTRYPDRRIRFVNAGVGADWAIDGLDRFKDDVASHNPDIVTVLFGMNDGSYQGYNDKLFEQYKRNMEELLTRIDALDATAILMGPTIFDTRVSRRKLPDWMLPGHPERSAKDVTSHYTPLLAYYGAWLRDQAQYRGLGYVDLQPIMHRVSREQRAEQPDFTMIPDTVHPDENGHAVMAFAILDQMGADSLVSSIAARKIQGRWEIDGGGGSISKVQPFDNGLAFTFVAESLPWVLPEEAQAGYGFVDAGHKLSQEKLRVYGLGSGMYTLMIDNEAVGRYSDEQLAMGIDLQDNPLTPQYQQALQVALLNKQRNKIVFQTREFWWKVRDKYHRPWRKGEKPKGYKAYKAKLDKEVADLYKQIEAVTNKIYVANQPAARRYEMSPCCP